jgi:RNA polymerase sigma factor (sigma-70 family)
MKDIEKVIKQAQAGDEAAFTSIVMSFQDMAVGYAFSIIRDFHMAEDVAQESFVSAYLSIRQLKEPAAFAGWFRRIIFTQCNRVTRRKTPIIDALEDNVEAASNEPRVDILLENEQSEEKLINLVNSLPEAQRTAITLSFIGGYSQKEISAFLGVPVSTIKSRLHKAKANLRGKLMEKARESLRGQRPSRSPDFVKRVRDLLGHAAAGNSEIVTRLIQNDASIIHETAEHPFWGGEPQALHVASEWGRKDVVELLLRNGADPNGDNDKYDGWSPLHLALHKDHGPAAHNEIVELLILYGAKIDLWAAAMMGDLTATRQIIESDPDIVNSRGPNSATALHFAADGAIVKMFLESGADPRAKDKYGKRPVRTLLGYGPRKKEAAIYLLDKTNDWDLSAACAVGDNERVASFVSQNPSLLRESGWNRETPLNTASLHGNIATVRLLLDLGADVNLKAESGCYPLHLAARNGHLDVAEVLIALNANLAALDDIHQGTALDWAEFQGQTQMASFLANVK